MTLPFEPLQSGPAASPSVQSRRIRVKPEQLDEDEFSSAFSTLQNEFKQKYKRDFRITGNDTGIHKRLHGSGRAKDKGTFIHDPALVSPEEVQIMVADGTHGQLLGHLEEKGPDTSSVVVARDPRTGIEQQASYASPENVQAQASELQRQFPALRLK